MRARRAASRRELGRYLVWQLPGWVLVAIILAWLTDLLDLAPWIPLTAFALYVAKDLALFPLVRAAFRGARPAGVPVGTRGVALEPLAPVGYVRIGGELWRAEAETADRPIATGRPVIVRGARGLTLLVEEAAEGGPTP